jgi:hypothetical protein
MLDSTISPRVDIAWPFACPRSWTEQSKPSLVRSTIDDGFPKVRRRFTRAWSEIQVTWILMWTDKDDLEYFFRVACADGAQPFTITDPITGVARRVRWKEPPSMAASVDTRPAMQVSATLETML